MAATLPPPIVLVPAAADLGAAVAARLVDEHRAQLPDLSAVTLLVPTPALIAPLASRFLRAAGTALLGPHVMTPAAFAAAHGRDAPALPALDCRLQLAQALRAHAGLFPQQDPFALADALFALLEELSVNAPELAEDPTRFVERITRAYGRKLGALSAEADFVHKIWTAFLEQTRRRSPAVADLDDLRSALARLPAGAVVHWVGFDSLSRAHAVLVREALWRGSARLWLHGRLDGRDGRPLAALCAALGVAPAGAPPTAPAFADRLFDDDAPAPASADRPFDGCASAPASADRPFDGCATLPERVAGATPPDARLCAATGPEHEARIVDLAVRQFLLDGCDDVAVVTPDRRLARRLRALLERAGVVLRDEVGWALSTSRASASLDAWLDCVERGTPFRSLLALFKSGFVGGPAVDLPRLERDIARREALQGDALLASLPAPARQHLQGALRRAPGRGAGPGHAALRRLIDSLAHLGPWTAWGQDAAGRRLVELLEQLHGALARAELVLDLGELRALVGRVLEQGLFMPDTPRGPVRLLTPEQARGLSCDALVLAGATAGAWPGAPPAPPVFNHGVRAELGLAHGRERHALHVLRWRNLLQAAPRLVVTWAAEKEGEPPLPSPFVEMLLAVAPQLADVELPRFAASPDAEIRAAAPAARPVPVPRPPAVAPLLPASLSSAMHQALVDCPYRFHAAACLGLSRRSDPDEPPTRKDYGDRVHRIMQAFEQAQPGLPPPFGRRVLAADRAAAAARLTEIAEAVFAPDLAQRYLARIWLDEFRAQIPALVDWLVDRGTQFAHVDAEVRHERELAPGLALHGRIDRLESSGASEHRVVDYKTGVAPKEDAVLAGEAVQPTHYALLAGNCVSVEFLQLRRERRAARLKPMVVDGAPLADALAGVAQRLRAMVPALRAGAPLPAQGDALTCGRCDFAGLCRRGAWQDE